ncbi:MAG: ribbon-helix-helix domain-containing protein [Actinobacteria bacterium]|nr:ribbon-helix-helix domain-containing protein [Actinomycetota bacterium]MCL5986380.1 ribbon-helix-helix domain-containing protein [Actinomycetota bacterium]
MKKLNIYFDDNQYENLREKAYKNKTTMSEIIREAVDEYLKAKDKKNIRRIEDDPIFEIIGMFDSGIGDLGINHDKYLYDEPKK